MKILFDTSVIIAALVDQLPNHEAAFETFLQFSSASNQGYCSTHALAECYAVMTALPLSRRILPDEARTLIEESIRGRLTIVDLSTQHYISAIDRVASQGAGSGLIYDALHVEAAIEASCKRVYSYNLAHFRRIVPTTIELLAP